jgi:Fe-S-cluster containining protein
MTCHGTNCGDCRFQRVCCILDLSKIELIVRPDEVPKFGADFVEPHKDGTFRIKTDSEGRCAFHNTVTGECMAYDRRPDHCKIYPIYVDSEGQIVFDQACPGTSDLFLRFFRRDPGAIAWVREVLQILEDHPEYKQLLPEQCDDWFMPTILDLEAWEGLVDPDRPKFPVEFSDFDLQVELHRLENDENADPAQLKLLRVERTRRTSMKLSEGY